MYLELFQQLGLSKNEAEIYEALLSIGQSSVAKISRKTNINRRNIYDVLGRLIEKGLVFEIIEGGETRYNPVDPKKMGELLYEKQQNFETALPDLQSLYSAIPQTNEVFVYKGAEGWKNYMRDMLRVGEPAYFISAKGGWLDERVKDFFPIFWKAAKKQKMQFYHLFDSRVKEEFPEILSYITDQYRFIPEKYSTPGAIDIFGDHVNLISSMKMGEHQEDLSFTVIVNKQMADSFRTWFQFMWDNCPPQSKTKRKKNT